MQIGLLALVSPVASLTGLNATLPVTDEGVVQEVFRTELVYPQRQGEVQITLRLDHEDSDEGKASAVSVGSEYGLTDAWQIGAAWPLFKLNSPDGGQTTRGIGDLELGTKYSFLNLGGSTTHFAVAFEMGLPTGDVERGLGEGFLEFSPSVMVSHDLAVIPGLNLFAQAGVSLVDRINGHNNPADDEPAAHEFFLSGGGIFRLGEAVAASIELNWQDNTWNHDGDDHALWITPGIHFLPADGWQLGAGISLPIDSEDGDLVGTVLCVYEF